MLLTEIQRFSTHDGPGCRTTVFFKGCSMRCLWCHNPETQNPEPEHQFFASKCIKCGHCAEGCYSGARTTVGKEYTPSEVMEILLRDQEMFSLSGGGVTFSGGEPFLQSDDLLELLQQCQTNGIHTAVETAACVAYRNIEACLPYIDLIYCDIKVIDETLHRQGTGASNALILENIQKIAHAAPALVLRTPVIPGFNDTEKEIAAICDFVVSLPGNRKLELLKYHSMGASKYKTLNLEYTLTGELEDSLFESLKSYVQERGLWHESH